MGKTKVEREVFFSFPSPLPGNLWRGIFLIFLSLFLFHFLLPLSLSADFPSSFFRKKVHHRRLWETELLMSLSLLVSSFSPHHAGKKNYEKSTGVLFSPRWGRTQTKKIVCGKLNYSRGRISSSSSLSLSLSPLNRRGKKTVIPLPTPSADCALCKKFFLLLLLLLFLFVVVLLLRVPAGGSLGNGCERLAGSVPGSWHTYPHPPAAPARRITQKNLRNTSSLLAYALPLQFCLNFIFEKKEIL